MKIKITLLILFLTTLGFAQNGINYKAVIKDDTGNVVANDLILIQFSILQGAAETNVYTETHSPTTDANGIVIVNIGEGTPVSGTFASIDWASDDHYLNVQINVGDGLTDMGTTQFKTVPYAIASGDKSWEVETDNVHVLTKNVGIGTTAPTELLHIYDEDKAGINLSVPSFSDESQIEFKNGSETGFHSFYKILNRNDALRFELDTDLLGTGEGYESKMTLSNSGLALENGIRINEFSTDGTLAGNSNIAVPTEAAVKAYADSVGPLAYGMVLTNSNISSGSGNYTTTWNASSGRYEITISGENYFWQFYTTIVTGSSNSIDKTHVDSVNGKLLVYLYNSAGSSIQGNFQFITYK